jgi:lysine 6-dehydrogenase
MNILILGAGLMGRAITYDLFRFSDFEKITLIDNNKKNLQLSADFLEEDIEFQQLDLKKANLIKNFFKNSDIAISAVPYSLNYTLAKIAVDTQTNFLDLGGNNDIVKKERSLMKKAKENKVTIIPDCGLAPGLTSVITRDIVEQINEIEYVKIRVGGLPIKPIPPLNYQIVFSLYGLINEYVEESIILKNGNIIKKPSMTEIEEIKFPKPFGIMEAFLTSGGCSTLPYTYRNKIGYLDYKTIRYLGHCKKFIPLLNIKTKGKLVEYLINNLPKNEKDVVLLKVFSKGIKDDLEVKLQYTMIDYYDEENNITSMMRTTAYPTSIIANMINQNIINKKGVFCPEEVVPCDLFFKELKKRNINIQKEIK